MPEIYELSCNPVAEFQCAHQVNPVPFAPGGQFISGVQQHRVHAGYRYPHAIVHDHPAWTNEIPDGRTSTGRGEFKIRPLEDTVKGRPTAGILQPRERIRHRVQRPIARAEPLLPIQYRNRRTIDDLKDRLPNPNIPRYYKITGLDEACICHTFRL